MESTEEAAVDTPAEAPAPAAPDAAATATEVTDAAPAEAMESTDGPGENLSVPVVVPICVVLTRFQMLVMVLGRRCTPSLHLSQTQRPQVRPK